MPDDKELGITIGVATKYDPSGVSEAQQDMETVYRRQQAEASAAKATADAKRAEAEATRAAAEAAKAKAAADRQAAADAARERAEEEAVARAMELAAMTVKQLEAEVRRLNEARRQAAAAGDREAYRDLTEQAAAAKQAHEKARNAANLNTAAWAGQIQAAATLGNSVEKLTGDLGHFAANAKSGTLDIGGMTAAMGSLAASFKAGLGPLALAIYSLEQLQKVYKEWDKYFNGSSASLASVAKDREAQAAAFSRAQEAFREANRKYRDAQAEAYKARGEQIKADLDAQVAAVEKAAKAQAAAEDEASRHRLAMLTAERRTAEGLDAERIDKAIAAEEKAANDRAATRAAQEADAAELYARQLEEQLQDPKLASLLQIQLPDMDALATLEARLAASREEVTEEFDAQYHDMEVQRARIANQMRAILAEVKKVDPEFRGTAVQAVEWLQRLKETDEEQRKTLEAARKIATAARESADTAAAATRHRNEELEASRRADEAQKARAAAEEAATKAQQERAEQLRGILSDTKTSRRYAPKETRTEREILAADAELLRQRESQLLALRSRAVLTDAERKEIDDALHDVRTQTRGLAEIQRANSGAAMKWLAELQPPKLQAENKRAQRSVNIYAKRYATLASRAKKAAENGHERQLETLKGQIARTAAVMGKVSGKTAQSDRLLQDTLTALEETRKAHRRAAAAAEDGATAAEQAVKSAADRAPREVSPTDRPMPLPPTDMGAVQAATTGLGQQQSAILAAVRDLTAAVVHLSSAVGSLSTEAEQAASAAQEAAQSCRTALGSMRKNLNKAMAAINDIRRGL